jgi:hypothetical protein
VVVVRQRSGDEGWRRLKLDVRVKEREGELSSEGKRCRGAWGWSLPFYRG